MARPGPRTIYRYSRESKATAVRLSQIPGVAVGDVAESLYIHPFMLSLWRKQAREGVIVTKGVAVAKEVAAELKELRKVKKAYEQLKMEYHLLKESARVRFLSKSESSFFVTLHKDAFPARLLCRRRSGGLAVNGTLGH